MTKLVNPRRAGFIPQEWRPGNAAIRMLAVTSLLIPLMLMGCAAQSPTAASARRTASMHAGSSMSPNSRRITRLAQAVPLDRLRQVQDQVELISWLHPPIVPRALYFGHILHGDRDDDASTQQAFVAWKNLDHWTALPFADRHIRNPAWVYVGAGPRLNEIWGALDSSDDQPATDLLLVHSTDGGSTWNLLLLHKPHRMAEFDTFSMSADGSGHLSLYLSPGQSTPASCGYYRYDTTDGGSTWSAPRYESDQMLPAPDAPQQDQPQVNRAVAMR